MGCYILPLPLFSPLLRHWVTQGQDDHEVEDDWFEATKAISDVEDLIDEDDCELGSVLRSFGPPLKSRPYSTD